MVDRTFLDNMPVTSGSLSTSAVPGPSAPVRTYNRIAGSSPPSQWLDAPWRQNSFTVTCLSTWRPGERRWGATLQE